MVEAALLFCPFDLVRRPAHRDKAAMNGAQSVVAEWAGRLPEGLDEAD